MKKLTIAVAGLVATANSAFAADCLDDFGQSVACAASVPEISALEGTAALAVVAALVLLAWERRRRAA